MTRHRHAVQRRGSSAAVSQARAAVDASNARASATAQCDNHDVGFIPSLTAGTGGASRTPTF